MCLDFYAFMVANPFVIAVEDWRHITHIGYPLLEAVLRKLTQAGFRLDESLALWAALADQDCISAAYASMSQETKGDEVDDAITQVAEQLGSKSLTEQALRAPATKPPDQVLRRNLAWLVGQIAEPDHGSDSIPSGSR